MTPAYIITDKSITVVVNGRPITIDRVGKHADAIIEAIKDDEWEVVAELMDMATTVVKASSGSLRVEDGVVYYEDEVLYNYVVERILDFCEQGIAVDSLLKFTDKLMENPSKRCVDELFAFLEHGNMPIDPDGDFYAYKAVQNNWMDKHSGKFSNRIGERVEITRNKVDDNSSIACSYGLHAGSLQYVQGFACSDDRMIIVKINPKDVVAVPKQEDNKLRCCGYEVVEEYRGPLPDNSYDYNDNDDLDYDDEDTTEYFGAY